MARETVKKDIGSFIILTTPFAVTKGKRLGAKLLQMVQPSLNGLKNISGDMDAAELMPPLVSALISIGTPEGEKLCMDLLSETAVQTKGDNAKVVPLDSNETVDVVFGDDLVAYAQALTFAVRSNFQRFLGEGWQILTGANPQEMASPE